MRTLKSNVIFFIASCFLTFNVIAAPKKITIYAVNDSPYTVALPQSGEGVNCFKIFKYY